MENQLYRETLLEVAQNPKNRGEIVNPDLEARLLNPLCGDEIRLQIKLTKNQPDRRQGGSQITNVQTVQKAVFSGNGCAISQASASLLAEYIVGKSLGEVKDLNSDIRMEILWNANYWIKEANEKDMTKK